MKINDSDLFFTCSLIELIGRTTKQKRSAVTSLLGKKVVSHIFVNAGVLHCEPIAKTAEVFIGMCNIPVGNFDNVADCKYEVPDYWTIGKVFARLIEDVTSGDVVETLIEVYSSPICDAISNFNSDFFYQPRGFIKEYYLEECKSKPAKRKTPVLRFSGFTDAWEQRELGKTTQITMGQSPDGSTYSDSPSTYILVQGNADLKDGWVVPRIWTTQATKQATAGDLIMSVRAPAGAMGKTAYDVVLGRGVAALKGSEFIYQYLVKMDSDGYWKKLSCGSTFESLNSDNIYAAEISIPSTGEQQKIGQFFESLDQLITLHQRERLFLILEEILC